MTLDAQEQQILRLERSIAVLFTFLLGLLYILIWFHAGGLWRDEVNTVNITQLSSSDLCLARDSFPILLFWLIKLWSYVTVTDNGLRVFGLLMGFATISVAWWAGRAFRLTTPLVAIFLIASIPTAIQAGTSLRAYGCGMVLIIASAVVFWRMIEKPSAGRIAATMLISILAVQCLFQNAVLLFALGAGALASAVYLHSWRITMAVALSGIAAGLSLTPYYNHLFVSDWMHIVKSHPDWTHMLFRFIHTLGGIGRMILWSTALVLVLTAAIYACVRHHPQTRLIIFSATSLTCVIAAYAVFLKYSGLYLQPWYFLPCLALCAILLGALTDTLLHPHLRLRATLVALLAVVAALLSPTLVQTAQVRWTNIDLITQALQPVIKKHDLIVLNSAWEGITFKRYYQGQTTWISLPGFDGYEHKTHELARMKQAMQEEEPLADILAPIEVTLRSGHRVWLIGNFSFVRPGETAFTLPPAPNSPYGWYLPPYERYWSSATAGFVQEHALNIQLARPPDENVNPYENLPVFVAQGWRD